MPRPKLLAVCLFVGLFVCRSTGLLANMGPPSVLRAGSPAGEVQGVPTVRIAREQLQIDLRPLATAEPVPIAVKYWLDNEGPPRTLDLLFVGGPMADRPTSIRLDGQSVATTSETLSGLPASWVVPKLSNSPHAAMGAGRPLRGLRFQLELTAGPHEVEVDYAAEAWAEASTDEERIRWHVPYVLAPARAWQSFGELELTVQVPANWQVESSLKLTRDEQVLTGVFFGIPADVLVLQARAPDRYPWAAAAARGRLAWALLVLGILGTLASAVWLGRWLARRGRSAAWTIPLTVLIAAGWLLGTPLAAWLVQRVQVALAADAHQASWYYGGNSAYGIFFGTLALALVAPLAWLLAALCTAVWWRRVGGPLAVANEKPAAG